MNSKKLEEKDKILEREKEQLLREAIKLKEEIEREREKAAMLAKREQARQAERERKAIEREKEK